ncbi:MAG: hypothetical protein EOO77_05600, partial [Oxalobacteraceae bacterium]
MSDARPSGFRDLSTWDAVIAATFGIAVSEGVGALGRVSGAGQIGTGMLAAGLLLGAMGYLNGLTATTYPTADPHETP